MPNWKKVVTSGSNATLNHITASGNINASGNIIASNVYMPGGSRISFDDALDGTDQYIYGEESQITIESDNYLNVNSDIAVNLNTPLVSADGNISSSLAGTVSAGSGSFHVLKGDTTQATSLEVNGPITASGGIISDNIETFWTSFNCDGDGDFGTSMYGPNTQGINYYHWNKNWSTTTSDSGNPTGDNVHRSEINSGWYVPYKLKIVELCGGLHDGNSSSTVACEVGLWNTAASLASSNYDTNSGTTKEFIVSGSVTLNGNRWKYYSQTCDVTLEEGQYVLPRVKMGENLTNLRGQFTIKFKRVQ
jgi:hypothetical protein